MTVLIYIAIFTGIVAALSLAGALTESERVEDALDALKEKVKRTADAALSLVLYPVEAAYDFIAERRTR